MTNRIPRIKTPMHPTHQSRGLDGHSTGQGGEASRQAPGLVRLISASGNWRAHRAVEATLSHQLTQHDWCTHKRGHGSDLSTSLRTLAGDGPMKCDQPLADGKPWILGSASRKLADEALSHLGALGNLGLRKPVLAHVGNDLLPIHARIIAITIINVNRDRDVLCESQ